MNCKMQRRHARDKTKRRRQRRETTEGVDALLQEPVAEEESDENAPKEFGELVTSDSIFLLKRKQAESGINSTAHVIKDRGTGWTRAFPAANKSSQQMMQDMLHFTGGQKIQRRAEGG